MFSVIVVPAGVQGPDAQIRLGPGEVLTFGRGPHQGAAYDAASAGGGHLTVDHPGVSRTAGRIAATGTFWTLTNLSRRHTYVVENPEGAGEYIKITPGRIEAPVPFEFSRVVLPATDRLLTFDVWAPRHDFLDREVPSSSGEPTASAFPLDHSKRYFQVLAALCEPRLRQAPHSPLPTVKQIVERLRPNWPKANAASVQWNIDYLAVKLRLKAAPEAADPGPRLNGKKEALVSLALRFDLVREEDLGSLGTDPGALGTHPGAPCTNAGSFGTDSRSFGADRG
ncbi:FHA domain-containing protein [Streptomyces sp. NPDC058045]|uniref:FHA domain-containing protein n=1 Tax=Streptomyces sp. NPDC058045 TaxID=3346311 RepID=UPI0036E414AC